MLILTRRFGERIMIGDDIVVKVIAMAGRNQVQIGIEAPRDVKVMREELIIRDRETGEEELRR